MDNLLARSSRYFCAQIFNIRNDYERKNAMGVAADGGKLRGGNDFLHK